MLPGKSESGITLITPYFPLHRTGDRGGPARAVGLIEKL